MANVIAKGTKLPTQVVEEMFNAVRGNSAIARLSQQRPIPFNGVTEMVFTMDHEASIVGENGAKVNGGAAATPVVIRPYKFEYGVRVSDEFMYGTEEYRMNVLRTFAEGAARKFARGMDIGAFHGFNPYSGAASAVVGNNHFDYAISNIAAFDPAKPRATVRSAVTTVEASGAEVTGIAFAPEMGNELANEITNGIPANREFYDSLKPETFLGVPAAVNPTVNAGLYDMAIVGDFSAFRWGYAKEIPLEVIEYGNPDNDADAGDLKGHNQVYLRAEAYIGWGILVPSFFALIKKVQDLSLASVAGTASGDTKITVTPTKETGNSYYYYVGTAAEKVLYGQDVSGGTSWDGTSDITAATGKILTLVEADSDGKALKVGTVTVTAHA